MTEDSIRQIAYGFGDASVPQQFHRSYRITVSPGEVSITVDSYGDILAEKTYEIADEQFREVVASLTRNQIRHVAPREGDPGATGGTSETISYWDAEREIFSGTVYHCAGRDTGTLGGNVKGFADDIKRLVPDLARLLDTA